MEDLPESLVILIVDDDLSQATLLARLFTLRITIEDHPLEVITVATLAEGLFYANRANVTLLDLNLPDSTPENSLEAIKIFPPPVIVISGNDDPAARAKAIMYGAKNYILKGQMVNVCTIVLDAIIEDILRKKGIDPTQFTASKVP